MPGKLKISLILPPNDLGMGDESFTHVVDTYQPLGIAYIAAVLERDGFDVQIIDAKVEELSIEEVIQRVLAHTPRIVGISVSTPDFDISCELTQRLKEAGDCLLVIGGKHVSGAPQETMTTTLFDYGVIGEGEQTMTELAAAIAAGETEKIPEIPGLIFRDGHRCVRTPPRDYVENLDTLPFPARHLLPPPDKYQYLYYKHLPIATIVTSRGCPYQCIFCDHSVFGYRARLRSIGNVIDEIEMLVRQYGIRGINIMDDIFGIIPERIYDFCRQLKERDLNVAWSCFSRVDTIGAEMLSVMKKAGCWMVGYGLESGDQSILNTAKKNTNLECAVRAITLTRKSGIRSLGFFILGLPGETQESLEKTLAFVRRLPLDRVVFFIPQPFPGTELYHLARDRGELDHNVPYRYYHNFCFSGKLAYMTKTVTSDLLQKYRARAYREFYFRPQYLLRQLGSYHEVRLMVKRIPAFFKAIT